MPFFSVVIPTFNRSNKLAITVRSVLEQEFQDFELLIMDDGSTDNTEEIVRNFADSRISYEWAPNSGGPATPRNRGIAKASSSWITFLDADDIWYPTRLSEVAKAITYHTDIDVFCHNEMLHIREKNKKTLLRYGPFEDDFYRVMLTKGNRLSTSATTLRTDFLLKNNLRFNQHRDYVIVEDYDLWLRLANQGARFGFIDKPLGEYIIEDDNISLLTERSRHNQKVLLSDHVYKIQQFEPNKDKLWNKICTYSNVRESYALLLQGKIIKGLNGLMSAILNRPLEVINMFAIKLRKSLHRV